LRNFDILINLTLVERDLRPQLNQYLRTSLRLLILPVDPLVLDGRIIDAHPGECLPLMLFLNLL
jgi:hypothetical protein